LVRVRVSVSVSVMVRLGLGSKSITSSCFLNKAFREFGNMLAHFVKVWQNESLTFTYVGYSKVRHRDVITDSMAL